MNALATTYLQHLSACLNRQCSMTKAEIDRQRPWFANNRNVSGFSLAVKELIFTLQIKAADGAWVTDIDGNRYLDISMGFGVHLFGHRPPFLQEAMKEQLQHGLALGPLYPEAAEVARLITEMTGQKRCAFYNSGTEAVMVAMRLARAATGRHKIVVFDNCYHGTHDSLLSMRAEKNTHRALAGVPGVPQSLLDETVLLPYGSAETLSYLAEHGDEVAAVLIEPVQSRCPERTQVGFLQDLRKITHQTGIALIFDEIITGFRLHNGGGAAYFGIRPDLATYGKICGGGMPLGIVAGQARFLDYIDGGQWRFGDRSVPAARRTFVAGTFCHHPLAMATAKATLQHLKEHNNRLQQRLNEKTEQFCSEMNAFFKEEKYPIEIVGFGSFFRFLLKGHGQWLYHALLKEGVYIWEGRNCFLSTAHTDKDIRFLQKKIRKCCRELRAARVFPASDTINRLKGQDLHVAISVPFINPEWLEIAYRYLCESIPVIRHRGYTFALDSNDEENRTQMPFYLLLKKGEADWHLHFRAEKSCCDGWSMILFFRELAHVYTALSEERAIPLVSLSHDKANTSSTTAFPLFPAATVTRTFSRAYLPVNNGLLFAWMLTRFAALMDLDCVAVPVSGQLLHRQPKCFGNLSSQVLLTIDPELTLAEQARVFRMAIKHPSAYPLQPHPVVFNMDNLDFKLSFGREEAGFLPAEDALTAHPLVCNISLLSGEVVVSLKYDPARYRSSQIQSLLEKYLHEIAEPVTA